MTNQAEVIARELLEQHELREKFISLKDRLPTLNDAYDVQDVLVPMLARKYGTHVAGYKIALSSKQTQEWLKIDHPCGGQLLASRIHQSPYTVKRSDWVNVGIETEICVVLDRDLPVECSFEDVQRSLRSVHCAYELVEDFGADLTNLDPQSLVADNCWNGGIVMGPAVSPGLDLYDLPGRLKVDGKLAKEGTTQETIGGNPIEVVMWLARHLGTRGMKIEAGHVIITGTIIPTQFPKGGEVYEFEADGIPPVELRVLP